MRLKLTKREEKILWQSLNSRAGRQTKNDLLFFVPFFFWNISPTDSFCASKQNHWENNHYKPVKLARTVSVLECLPKDRAITTAAVSAGRQFVVAHHRANLHPVPVNNITESERLHFCHADKSFVFWGAFAKLRKATTSFVMSVRPHGITRLPLDGFSWNLIFEGFSTICREISSFIKIWKE
jgi:hypothetical protein